MKTTNITVNIIILTTDEVKNPINEPNPDFIACLNPSLVTINSANTAPRKDLSIYQQLE